MASGFNLEAKSRYGRKIRPTEKVRALLKNTTVNALRELSDKLNALEMEVRTRMCQRASQGEVRDGFKLWSELCDEFLAAESEYRRFLTEEEISEHQTAMISKKQSFAVFSNDVEVFVFEKPKKVRSAPPSRSFVEQETSRLDDEIRAVERRLREVSIASNASNPARVPVASPAKPPPAPTPTPTHTQPPLRRNFSSYVAVRPAAAGDTYVTVSECPPSQVTDRKPSQQQAPAMTASTPMPDATTMPLPSQSAVTVVGAPPTQSDDTVGVLYKLANILESKHDRLPRMEPEVFAGDPLQYPLWVNAFDALIEKNTHVATERLFYLGKYTEGEARESIVGYLSLFSEDAYDRARRVLSTRYGDKVKVAEAYRRRLATWHVIKKGEGKNLQRFVDFLWQCHAAISTVKNLSSLNSADEINKICRVLPVYVAEKWARVVDTWYYGPDHDDTDFPASDEGEYPPFVELCRLVSREARIATGPGAVMNDATQSTGKGAPPARDRPRRGTSLAITSGQSPEVAEQRGRPPDRKATGKPYCNFCKAEHWIQDCQEFLAKPSEEKRSFALYNSLCFGCLRKSHSYKDCKWKQPGLLKDGGAPSTNRAIAHQVDVERELREGMYYSMVVPVTLWQQSAPDRCVRTYALLDTQSDSCFMTEKLLEQLGASYTSVSLKLSTIGSRRTVESRAVAGLCARGHDVADGLRLPRCYSREEIPVNRAKIPRPEVVRRWSHLVQVADRLLPYEDDLPIGLLLGYNCPGALMPRATIQAGADMPYAVYTSLGWSVLGRISEESRETSDANCHQAAARVLTMADFTRALDLDFAEPGDPETMMSHDDKLFMQKVRATIRQRPDRHFEMDLPFRDDDVTMPNNRRLALKRLMSLRQRMLRDAEYKEQYQRFIGKLIDAGHAERAPAEHEPGKVNFLCHHGVRHPRKPGELRGTFDAAAEMYGMSLNSLLLSGPDLTNNLVGVLCRFRQERVAFMCDVKGMFLQVGVSERHRDFLRFLWFQDGDPDKEVIEYRMCVHSFGARSSPTCTNRAFKETADRYESVYSPEVADFLRRYFYVDDGLRSTPTDDDAVRVFMGGHEMCKEGGFFLHKFTCNSQAVLDRIPDELLATEVRDRCSMGRELPTETSLGVMWSLVEDCFLFLVSAIVKEFTRRGLLGALSSVYDPLGLLSPVLLTGRLILQQLCFISLAWDAEIPEVYRSQWDRWHASLNDLVNLRIPRCFRSKTSGELRAVRLHHFSDASQSGYGMCSYLQLVDEQGAVDVSLVMGKARVPPKRPVTMPRLELQAAVLAAKVSTFVRAELDYEEIENHYWCDSQVVLAYITNATKKFHIYVANRAHYIREHTDPACWRYVKSAENPADLTSRGCTPAELIESSLWWQGPEFLRRADVAEQEESYEVAESDPELKKEAIVMKTIAEESTPVLTALCRYSSWHRMLRAVCVWRRYFEKLRRRVADGSAPTPVRRAVERASPDVTEMAEAERVILAMVQKEAFPEEFYLLQRMRRYPRTATEARERKEVMKANSNLFRLDVYLAEDGLIHVGGRIRRADLPIELMHPRLLPKTHHVTELIVDHRHRAAQHPGRQGTLSALRCAGFWVVHGRAAVDAYTRRCVTCKRLRGRTVTQKMSDLPEERVEESPPFTHSGVDFCGPFYVKEGRSLKKRWI